MDDKSIVDLYFSRNQDAITQTDKKYGRYCYSIAYNILTNKEDADESVSGTYMTAWRAIPPRRPSVLSTFLGKITRHISIDKWRERSAYKRGGGEVPLALEELNDCAAESPEQPMVNVGRADVIELNDGWTVKTADRSLSAHYENTVALTSNGVLILTEVEKGF